MHSALKKAAETEAVVDTAKSVAAMAGDLAAMREQLDRIESLFRESAKSTAPQPPKGGR